MAARPATPAADCLRNSRRFVIGMGPSLRCRWSFVRIGWPVSPSYRRRKRRENEKPEYQKSDLGRLARLSRRGNRKNTYCDPRLDAVELRWDRDRTHKESEAASAAKEDKAMRWQGRRGSGNVEDRRSMTPRAAGFGGGILGLLLILLVIYFGGDPRPLLQQMQQNPPAVQPNGRQADPAEEKLAQFVSVVLADTEDVWQDLFRKSGRQYKDPKLVLFRDRVDSACGFGSAATGPFYCPGDSNVYIDLSFFDEMARRLNAPGDFAQAYVIAHEVGHHVQNLMGISDRVHTAQTRAGDVERNELSVRLELQADFLAGVWAHHAQQNWNILEEGDIAEAMNAATAIGDDRLQRKSRGIVVPESFTHGTSEQRTRWFVRGLKTGDMSQGDTFGIPYGEL
jgi:predicted metalloprotease